MEAAGVVRRGVCGVVPRWGYKVQKQSSGQKQTAQKGRVEPCSNVVLFIYHMRIFLSNHHEQTQKKNVVHISRQQNLPDMQSTAHPRPTHQTSDTDPAAEVDDCHLVLCFPAASGMVSADPLEVLGVVVSEYLRPASPLWHHPPSTRRVSGRSFRSWS